MSQKKTPWFKHNVNPRHHGVYETIVVPGVNPAYQRWDGEKWYFRCQSVIEASSTMIISDFQFPRWRGLAQKREVV